ncbi:MAG: isocitrate lyase/PEP mutase family protein, partial [Gammaproteobacteria bacterium]|nr:isocitrate lyase/PEP mutase family protein [Gammaproteobacteria bacterium]
MRRLLEGPRLLALPGVFDALSARLAEQAGFPAVFMSGFAVSAARLGLPDTGLISYGELLAQGRDICAAVSIPVFGDGDTGFGNAVNVKRTVQGYARAGFACVMIEDQQSPKRCGHTPGKAVVERAAALARIRAAVDARAEGADILILARTDARATHGLEEAIARCRAFAGLGADITFLEAPESEAEMARYCAEVPGWKMANLVENGRTPLLHPLRLERMGYKIAVHPLTLLSAAARAMGGALRDLREGREAEGLLRFERLQEVVGFPEYHAEASRYAEPEEG